MAIPERVDQKIRKCLALAADPRGNETMRMTALRQAHALMRQHGLDLERQAKPAADRPIDWSQRASAEAIAAGLQHTVLCKDGWYTPTR